MPQIKIQRVNKLEAIKEIEVDEHTGAIILKSTKRGQIPGNSGGRINTGYAVEIPEGYLGYIYQTPNLVQTTQLQVNTQIVTADHREELVLDITNFTYGPQYISEGQSMAHLILLPKVEMEHKVVGKIKQAK